MQNTGTKLADATDATLFTDLCINPFSDRSDGEVLRLDELTRFFRHPAKHFLNQQLGVYFGEDQNALKDTESFTLDGLERYQIADQALQNLLYNEPIEAWVENLRASGLMLPGEFGQKQLQREVNLAAAVADELNTLNPGTPKSSSFELGNRRNTPSAQSLLSETANTLHPEPVNYEPGNDLKPGLIIWPCVQLGTTRAFSAHLPERFWPKSTRCHRVHHAGGKTTGEGESWIDF